MDGDVEVSQRKGKVISIFDVALTLEYEGMSIGIQGKGDTDLDQARTVKVPTLLEVSKSQSAPTTLKRMNTSYVLHHIRMDESRLTRRAVRHRHLQRDEGEAASQGSRSIKDRSSTPESPMHTWPSLD